MQLLSNSHRKVTNVQSMEHVNVQKLRGEGELSSRQLVLKTEQKLFACADPQLVLVRSLVA